MAVKNKRGVGNRVKQKLVSCNLCGGRNYETFLVSPNDKLPRTERLSATSQKTKGETLVKCLNCDLVFVNPRVVKEKILSQYETSVDKCYVKEERARSETFKGSLRTIQKYKDTGRLLDVGCAAGFFVKQSETVGFDAIGVEPNIKLVKWGRRNLGVDIIPGSIKSAELAEKSFDVITFWDVLEHLQDPLDVLRKIRRLLKKDGIVIINYPDINSVSAKIFGRNWWFVVSGHLYYFSPKTISKMLSLESFEVIEDRVHTQRLSLAYLLRQLGRYNQNLGNSLYSFSESVGLNRLIIPYVAGQRTTVARRI